MSGKLDPADKFLVLRRKLIFCGDASSDEMHLQGGSLRVTPWKSVPCFFWFKQPKLRVTLFFKLMTSLLTHVETVFEVDHMI